MSQTITYQQFLSDYHAFRDMMGKRSSKIENLDKAFHGLTFVWMGATVSYRDPATTDKQIEVMDSAFHALAVEWPKRAASMIVRPLKEILAIPPAE